MLAAPKPKVTGSNTMPPPDLPVSGAPEKLQEETGSETLLVLVFWK
jgi:hypothetical protein